MEAARQINRRYEKIINDPLFFVITYKTLVIVHEPRYPLPIEKDTLEDEDMCKICMDNQVDCVMLECGHMW